MRFTCRTEGCTNQNKEIYFFRTKIVILNGEKLVQESICPECGQVMKDTTQYPQGDIDIYFGKVASMSPQERKKVLKKRSTDHFNRKIKGRKEYMDRSSIGLK